ncbi:MAG: Stp1/IreP family PP2C-type Ser/Thr phosphatase [Clostridium sp.]|nr:Stp1/IreP family PP2C-type Ser/Thr phosphatase [Clostridium sp.]
MYDKLHERLGKDLDLKITAKTDAGKVRSQNQDAYAACELSPTMGWAVVCDGMGGHSGGNVASEVAVSTVSEGLNRLLHSQSTGEELRRAMGEVIDAANTRIYEMGEGNSELNGMGTTLVLCILREDSLLVAHAGDSRAYLLQEDGLKRLTSDHSYVQGLIERGEISEDEASSHPKKNLITRALGVFEKVEYDLAEYKIQRGDIILLCTDGLTNLCDDEELAQIAADTGASELPDTLIALANERGGTDNITAVAITA